jgi:hypothetical protein
MRVLPQRAKVRESQVEVVLAGSWLGDYAISCHDSIVTSANGGNRLHELHRSRKGETDVSFVGCLLDEAVIDTPAKDVLAEGTTTTLLLMNLEEEG